MGMVIGWGMGVIVSLIQMIQRHFWILFQTELLLDDEHVSQEFDETERAMRAQVGILENLSHKKCATDRKFVKQQPRTLAIRGFQ